MTVERLLEDSLLVNELYANFNTENVFLFL